MPTVDAQDISHLFTDDVKLRTSEVSVSKIRHSNVAQLCTGIAFISQNQTRFTSFNGMFFNGLQL